MIEAYDNATGDGQWFRQSLQILYEELSSVQRTKSQMAKEDRRADAGSNHEATAQKDLQSRSAG